MAGQTTLTLRDRSDLPASSRKLELVAPEEIALAVHTAIANAFGMDAAAVPAAACRLLGFTRVSEDMRARVDIVVHGMILNKQLERQRDQLVLKPVKP